MKLRGTRILIHQGGFSNPGNENEGKRVNSNYYDLNGKNGIAEKGGKKEHVPAIAENNDLEQGSSAQ